MSRYPINEADLYSMLNGYLASVNDEVQALKEQPDTKCCTHYLPRCLLPKPNNYCNKLCSENSLAMTSFPSYVNKAPKKVDRRQMRSI